MTVGKIISDLKMLIKEVSNDSDYTESFLWSLITKARARVLTNDIKAKQFISAWSTHRFCVEMELHKAHDCECIPVGCDVLRSKYTIPRPLSGRYRDAVQVKTIGNSVVGYSEDYELKSNKYDPVKKNALRWNIHNQHLYLYNTLDHLSIQVEGAWENIIEWNQIQYCSERNPCVDIYSLESGISEYEAEGLLRIAVDLLKVPLTLKDDTSQDTNPEIR